jgi:flagellar biosynthesis/type III secretory pathway protein FliH
MNKTKHLKRKRFLKKTKKQLGGASIDKTNSKDSVGSISEAIDEKEGVFDIVGDKVSDFAVETGDFLKNKTLRLFGLQPINEDDSDDKSQQVDESVSKLSDAASGVVSNAESASKGILSNIQSIGSDIVDVVDKGSAAVIGNINGVLESPKVETAVTEAAKETVEIGIKLLKKFNKNLNNPEFKEATKEALDNAADYTKIGVEALNEPLDQAIDEINHAGNKAAAGVAAGVIKVGTDALGAVPGVGAIIDVGKMINDGTKAASTVVEAGTEAAETASELFIKTNEGIKQGIQELEEKKKEAMNIANRTSDSINQFQTPSLDLSDKVNKAVSDKVNKAVSKVGGNKKSKKRLLKCKAKSKRVRFAL